MKIPHESSKYHVTGEAIYVDDINVNSQLLEVSIFYSKLASARIKSYDLSNAQNLDGVYAVLSYKDIPGQNQMGPVFHDEPVLATDNVSFIGQAIFLIAAKDKKTAQKAHDLITIEYEETPAILTIEQAIEKKQSLHPTRKIECGDTEKAFTESEYIIEGRLKTGAQEHWYLETQSCLCYPNEGNEMKVISSTQNPTETQSIVAEVLGLPKNIIEVETRRIGGAFGGKETQGNHVAAWAALLSHKTKQAVKIKLSRNTDQKITGKRHPFIIDYKVGFDKNGLIKSVFMNQHSNAGYASDLSMAILERAMLHAQNAYYIPNMKILGNAWKTNLPSNTAFRGFGGPQGMAAIESIIDIIARKLKKDASEVRLINFFGENDRNVTSYGQIVENNRLHTLYEQLMDSSEYQNRRKAIDIFNKKNKFVKRGIAITPVQFGISFTTSFLNQAGALVNVYTDGTVLVNHGGTEMGQGLYTKINQIAADEFGLDFEKVRVNATNTSKVPNTSPTAASSGTDLNGMAVKNAIDKIKKRIIPLIISEFSKNTNTNINKDDIIFENNNVYYKNNKDIFISFQGISNLARIGGISLSATGFYKTPNINFDREKGRGRPFHYFAFGMAVTEIELDILTGENKILRTDILHDAGKSINKNIDIGQIEGGYIQGVGWCTSEDCKRDNKGNLLNSSPDTYKIPGIMDIPIDFRVKLLENAQNPNTIKQSKAVGEPPFMLAFSAWLAIKDAISAIGNHSIEPDFRIPATNENILLSIEKLQTVLSKETIAKAR